MRLCIHSALLVALLAGAPAGAEEILADGIAAQVGSEIVLVSEVMNMVAATEDQMRKAGASELEIAQLRAEGLEQMIEWRIIEKIVRNAGLGATDAEIDEVIEGIARANGLTMEQLKASVTSQAMPYDSYREQIQRQIERQKVINGLVAARVRVDEQEIRDLYQERFSNQPESGTQVHVRQLLITGGQGARRDHQTACEMTVEAFERIRSGDASFERVAREVSVAAPEHGGDIGWLHEDSMASWMIDLLKPMQPGDRSEVIELPFGCTILKLIERREHTPVDYETAKDRLANEVFDRKVTAEYREWMEELRKESFIERRGYFADAAELRGSSASFENPTSEQTQIP